MNDLMLQILQGIGIALGAGVAYLLKLLIVKVKNELLKNSIEEVIEAATARVQDEFVDIKKKNSPDGKLSKVDREVALTKAIDIAFELAPEKLKPILSKLHIDEIRAMIQNILAKRAK